MNRLIFGVMTGLIVLGSILYLQAEDPLVPDKSAEEEGVESLDEGGKIYLKEKKIEVPGIIAHSNMPLELLACATGGKDYESLLVLKCSSSDIGKIHLALLMFGLKPGGGPKFFGDPTKPTGDLALVFVEWEEKEKTVCYRAEDLVIDLRTDEPMTRCGWAFTGSRFDDEIDFETGQPTGRKRYLAGMTKTIMSTYHDPAAILDNPTEAGGIPHVYEPNRKLMPEKMTEVKVIIRPPNKEELLELKKINEAANQWEKAWREKLEKEIEQEQKKEKDSTSEKEKSDE